MHRFCVCVGWHVVCVVSCRFRCLAGLICILHVFGFDDLLDVVFGVCMSFPVRLTL